MGHIRLGVLPRRKNWIQVINLIETGAAASELASASMKAAQGGLSKAAQDPGLIYSFWLLTQIPLAARAENFAGRLNQIGLSVPDNPSFFDIVSAFSSAVDTHLTEIGGRTDLGEMAQMAASESLTALGSAQLPSLFTPTANDVQLAFRSASTSVQFGYLARDFFARLSKRYLGYFLSRELSNHVGRNERFENIDEHTKFNEAFELHCVEAAKIVESFAGEWFSKAEYEGGITPEKISGFAHIALKKIRSEFARRTGTDG